MPINYTFDDGPDFRRQRWERGVTYVNRYGARVDAETRRRIERLVVPPAWTEVWISPDPDGHIQATGRDASGRKQFIYHPDWRSWREETKFLRVLDFASALPKLRERVARDLANRDATGERRRISSDDVNAYIREATGGDFTAEDFRTWAATVLAAIELCRLGPASSETAVKREFAKAVRLVATRLGNTPAVCRSSYIHPEILASYADGTLLNLTDKLEEPDKEDTAGLFEGEESVLRFLRRRLKQKKTTTAAEPPQPRTRHALPGSASAQALP